MPRHRNFSARPPEYDAGKNEDNTGICRTPGQLQQIKNLSAEDIYRILLKIGRFYDMILDNRTIHFEKYWKTVRERGTA